MWASAAVCGPLAPNVGRLDANVGLAPHVLAANLVPLWPCLWAHALLFVGHYSYRPPEAISRPKNLSIELVANLLGLGLNVETYT